MDDNGNLALTDFGMAKYIPDGAVAHSFVGTPEYLPPEIIS
jgi:serum/glucocorticoid-regulated kinase 2